MPNQSNSNSSGSFSFWNIVDTLFGWVQDWIRDRHDDDDDNNGNRKNIDGTDGDDVLTGNDRNNKITGRDGNDELYGLDGKDDLRGGDGDDLLEGGNGRDKLRGGDGNDTLIGGADRDDVRGGDGDDEIIWRAGDGDEKADGGDGQDSFTLVSSDTESQHITVSQGRHGRLEVTVDGVEGGELELKSIENFNLEVGLGGVTLDLGDAPDGTFDEPIDLSGGSGSDAIDVSDSTTPVSVDAGEGDDVVSGGSANDQISGGEGSDTISGGGGDDVIDAGVGDDTVLWSAGDGNDSIDGGEGFDAVDLTLDESQPGSLSVSADANGNVILVTDDGSQLTLDGVEDIIINAGSGGSTITIGDLTGTDIAQDTLYFVGGAGADSLDASATDRRINAQGNGGDDVLVSGSGNDILNGGDGNDVLDAGGGSGADNVQGGAGDDNITVTLGDEENTLATDLVDGGADNDSLNVIFVEPTPHDLVLRVSSNGDGSINIVSEDLGGFTIAEQVNASNIENLTITAGEGALEFELDSLADTSLTDGVSFVGSSDADSFDGSSTDVATDQHGGAGDDNLLGGSANDLLEGGAGNDSLAGNGGDDLLRGGEGDDVLDGGSGVDTADYSDASTDLTIDLGLVSAQDTGAAGMDTLVNVETVLGGSGNDVLTGNDADNTLEGGLGDDVLEGGDGFDVLRGGAGNDSLSDSAGGGALIGGSGDDFIDGHASYLDDPGAVQVNLSAAAADTDGDSNPDLAAQTARDGYGNTDTFGSLATGATGSQYADHLTGSAADNILRGRAGNDSINALAGDDIIFTGSGDDNIDGGDGFDYAHYHDDGLDGAGSATQGVVVDLASGTATDGFGDSDNLTAIEGVIGSALADQIAGDAQDNTLLARAGDDTVSGGAGNDTLGGWSGNDNLDGGAGEDLIIGDVGNDTLTGGSESDTFDFRTYSDGQSGEFGHDTITDFNVAEDVLDLAPFGLANLGEVQAIASDDGVNTSISIGVNQSITLQGVLLADLTAANFIFDDSTGGGPIVGTDGDDVLDGTPDADVIQGLDGFDIIRGYDGDDHLQGGADVDLLHGGDGSDLLDGGDWIDFTMHSEDPAPVTVDLGLQTATDGWGNTDTLINIEGAHGSQYDDLLLGSDSRDWLRGNGGNDLIYGFGGRDHILGGDGDDEIHAGADGSSFVDGGPGNDTITGDEFGWDNLNGGEGNDTLIDPSGSGILTGGAGDDLIDGRPGYESDPAGILINFDDSAWDVFGDGNQILAARTALDGYGGTDTLQAGAIDLNASNFDDHVQGSAFHQFFDLRGGNDTAYGLGGDDGFRGGSGDDYLDGGDGFDNVNYEDDGYDDAGPASQGVVVNLSGSDFSYNYNGLSGTALANSAVDGWGNTDQIFNMESVNGSEMADVIVGHEQHDWLWGGAGDDQIYGGGDGDNLIGYSGNDLLDGQSGDWDTAWYDIWDIANGVTVDLSAGIATDDGFGDQDTLVSIENVRGSNFADTIVGDAGSNNLHGMGDDDVIHAGDSQDWLYGNLGNDQLFGEGGDDWLQGNEGDDLLDGGAGNYDWANYGPWTGTTSGINVDLSVLVNAGGYNNVSVVSDDGHGDTDYLRGIENLNGTDFDDQISGNGSDNRLEGYAGNDQLNGGDGHDYLLGHDDFDTLTGGAGDDMLDGGENDDVLTGGSGYDRFRFSNFTNEDNPTSFGQDIITDFDLNQDRLDLWDVPHILNYDALLNASSQVGSDVVISFITNTHGVDETNSITLQNFNLADLEHIDINYGRIAGTENDDVLFAPAGGAYVDAREGNDILNGSADRDDLDGGPGNDQLFGNDGDDNLRGGDGADSIDGGNGWDQLDYRWTGENQGVVVDLSLNQVINDGFGNQDSVVNVESVQGSEFDDVIIGDALGNNLRGREGDDSISGGAEDDWIEGDEGHDELFGDDGDDVLIGEQGNDLLDGGAGQDRVNYDDWTGSYSGVTVDLSAVQASAGGYSNVVVASDGQGGTDYLRSIEDLQGSSYSDHFTGDAGENQFNGQNGDDTLIGLAGNDGLDGGDGNDTLDGGAGEDWFFGGRGNDTIDGGADWDHLAFDEWTDVNQGIQLDLSSNLVSNDGFGDQDMVYNIESIGGSAFGDVITGDANDNYLEGRDGNDVLTSNGGSDFLRGDNGDDTLIVLGGTGHAGLEGGSGNDQFTLSDGRNIHIHDFVAGAGSEDVIDLAGIAALTDFASVLAAASDDGGGNTNIDLGGGFNLHLSGVNTANLHGDDFLF